MRGGKDVGCGLGVGTDGKDDKDFSQGNHFFTHVFELLRWMLHFIGGRWFLWNIFYFIEFRSIHLAKVFGEKAMIRIQVGTSSPAAFSK